MCSAWLCLEAADSRGALSCGPTGAAAGAGATGPDSGAEAAGGVGRALMPDRESFGGVETPVGAPREAAPLVSPRR